MSAKNRLDEIRGRVAKATPGEWEWDTGEQPWQRYRLRTARGCDEVIVPGFDGEGNESMTVSNANADLIAHAPADLAHLLTLLDEAEATILNERGEGPVPAGWYWADGQWNRETAAELWTVDRNGCPTSDDPDDFTWLPTTWTFRRSRWDDEEHKHTAIVGTYPTARKAIAALATPTEPPK